MQFTYSRENYTIALDVQYEIDMKKISAKVLVLTVMFFAFIGQAIAFGTAAPCDSFEEQHSSSEYIMVDFNNDSVGDINSKDECCDVECCDLGCFCIANACSSLVYLITEINATNASLYSESDYLHKSEQTKSVAASHFRPPILTS